ncbi:MAG: undecaprenyl/decaprenyl-phosphate alpha-N-acetylglucosaminyl 1-phosphate transferase [Clostridia bacterium]|nr:undecaprenyl/decaprenyl-phosphate alpha-N-acetylglucosaminyl 1-phosphate transferase [Clostridia bacterium]
MLLALATAFAAVIVLMPFTVAFAWRSGAIDVPRDWRRMHKQSVPRNGGMAIILGLTLGSVLLEPTSFLGALLVCGFAVFFVGLADDVYSLSPWIKLGVQGAAAVGIVIETTDFQAVESVGAVIWILLLTNAHNFIDGLDGLFGGVAITEACGLGLLLWVQGEMQASEFSFLLGVACFAFRLFNRHPAKIFAGDCGSGSVGFLLGALSLPLFQNGASELVVSAGLLFAYPLTDLGCAVLRRVLRGKSPFHADRGHLHHRICDAGVTKKDCVAILLGISFGLCGLAVLIGAFHLYDVASVACILLATLLIVIRHRIVLQT